MFDVALKWFGRLRGGLCVAGIMACALFGAMCGVSIAGAVTIGIVAIPAMIRHGYDKGLAAGSVTCAGTLAIMIPPAYPSSSTGSLLRSRLENSLLPESFPAS